MLRKYIVYMYIVVYPLFYNLNQKLLLDKSLLFTTFLIRASKHERQNYTKDNIFLMNDRYNLIKKNQCKFTLDEGAKILSLNVTRKDKAVGGSHVYKEKCNLTALLTNIPH